MEEYKKRVENFPKELNSMSQMFLLSLTKEEREMPASEWLEPQVIQAEKNETKSSTADNELEAKIDQVKATIRAKSTVKRSTRKKVGSKPSMDGPLSSTVRRYISDDLLFQSFNLNMTLVLVKIHQKEGPTSQVWTGDTDFQARSH